MSTRFPETKRAIAGTILALVLPIRPRTVHYRFENEPAGDSTLLAWARQRLGWHFTRSIVCEDADSGSLNPCAALCRLIEDRSPAPQTVICCNLEAAFLPDRVLIEALDAHRVAGVQCTKVIGVPKGVSIACCEAEALLVLERLSRSPSDTDPAALIGQLVIERLTGRTDVPPLTIATYHANLGPAPLELRVETRWSVDLAGRVAESGEEDLLACWARLEAEPRRQPVLGRPPSGDGRLRALFFSAQSGWSGAEAALAGAVAAMRKEEIAASAFIPMDGLFAERMRLAGCLVDIFETNIASATPENVRLMERLLDRVRPQVIHINSPGGVTALAAAEPRGIPCVQHLRVADMSRFSDVSAGVTARIAVSDYIKHLAGDTPNTHVIPDGVDSERFAPEAYTKTAVRRTLGLSDSSLVVLVTARLDPQKRHDLLLEAFRDLSHETADALLLMAGDGAGNPNWVRYLDNQISELGLSARVRRLGFVQDVRPLYAASDVYVACGEGEALGCSLLEAMSMRLPVLVSDHGGQAELVDPGRSGILFPTGDVSALASGLLSMLDVNARYEMGLLARRRVLDFYTVERAAEQMSQFLSSFALRR